MGRPATFASLSHGTLRLGVSPQYRILACLNSPSLMVKGFDIVQELLFVLDYGANWSRHGCNSWKIKVANQCA